MPVLVPVLVPVQGPVQEAVLQGQSELEQRRELGRRPSRLESAAVPREARPGRGESRSFQG